MFAPLFAKGGKMSVDPLDYFLQAYDKKSYAKASALSEKELVSPEKIRGKAGGEDEEDGLSFADFLDVINPLQHIPFVSSIYREITGDEISDTAKFAGDALFTGLTGGIGALSLFSDFITQKDVAEHIADFTELAFNTEETPDDKTKIAEEVEKPQKTKALAEKENEKLANTLAPLITSAPVIMANEVDINNSFWLRG